MLGFDCEDHARDAFQHYDPPKFIGRIDAVPMDRFRREVRTTRAEPRLLKEHKNMRDAARAYGDRHLFGKKVTNAETGLSVQFTTSGIKHTVGHGSVGFSDPEDHHRKAVAALPELIRHATLHSSEPDRKARPQILGVHHLAAPLMIGNARYVANMTVREQNDGAMFYDHHLRLVQADLPAPVGTQGLQPRSAGADRGVNIRTVREAVNRDRPMAKAILLLR